MNGYAAEGSIEIDGRVLTKRAGFNEKGCASLLNAKANVVKGLANKLRAHMEGVEDWVNWPDLSSEEKNMWSKRVAQRLTWETLQDGKRASLSTLTSTAFVSNFMHASA